MHRMRNLQEELPGEGDQSCPEGCRDRSGEVHRVRDVHRGLPEERDREAVIRYNHGITM